MRVFVLFLICLTASAIGSLVGAGGGIIIKPTLDSIGILPVSTVSFLSSCTVLSMSAASLLRSRHNGVQIHYQITTPLAIGSIAGGFLGKGLFEIVQLKFQSERILGLIQAGCLSIITAIVLLYICKKSVLPAFHVKSKSCSLLAGTALGLVSSFLGVGGGPYNVALLFLLFSMEAKEAAKNSIYIILFSQSASLLTALVSGTVPAFECSELISMVTGGITGAILGTTISKRISSTIVEAALKLLCGGIILMNLWNVFHFIYG